MTTDELKATLNLKWVLLDTNIFIKAFESPDAFEKLFVFFNNCKCEATYFELIEFEFTKNVFLAEHRQARENFFRKIAPSPLASLRGELIHDALEISRIYAHQKINKGQIALVDCCIAAYLKKHASTLFFVTLNHKDFPLLLFDRHYIYPIDTQKEVLAPAFYQFNLEKFNKLSKELNKANRSHVV